MKRGIQAVALLLFLAVPAFGQGAGAHESKAKDCLTSGDFEGAAKAYGDAVRAYLKTGAREQAMRTALDAFDAFARAEKPDHAAPFVVEALAAGKREAFPLLKTRVEKSVGAFLKTLHGKKAFDKGVRFLETAIEELEKGKAYSLGLSEGHFRRCLDPFLFGAKKYGKALANGEALAALGKKSKYRYWEVIGSLSAGKACVLAGKHAEALERLGACLKAAKSIDDKIQEGYAKIWTGEARCALQEFDEAEQSALRAEKIFKGIRDRKGEADARNLRLKIAKAMKDEKKIRQFPNSASGSGGAGGAGGAGGNATFKTEAEEFCRKVRGQVRDLPVLRIYRKGNRLVFRNLFTRKETTRKIEYKFHYESVFGLHFQFRGPEVQFVKIAPNQGFPGVPGESVSVVNGEVHVRGPDLDPFRCRHFVGRKGIVVLTSSGQLYRRGR